MHGDGIGIKILKKVTKIYLIILKKVIFMIGALGEN